MGTAYTSTGLTKACSHEIIQSNNGMIGKIKIQLEFHPMNGYFSFENLLLWHLQTRILAQQNYDRRLGKRRR